MGIGGSTWVIAPVVYHLEGKLSKEMGVWVGIGSGWGGGGREQKGCQ